MCTVATADDDDGDDASWLYARQSQLAYFIGVAVIRDIINALFGTGGKNPLGYHYTDAVSVDERDLTLLCVMRPAWPTDGASCFATLHYGYF